MTTENRSNARTPLTVAVVTGIAIIVLALAVIAYASPYLALSRLRDAAQARNAAMIDRYVDYPALRASLKEQVTQMLSRRIDREKLQHPFAALGALVGMAFVSPLVDAYATPDGVAALLNGLPPRGQPGEVPPSASDERSDQALLGAAPSQQASAAEHSAEPRNQTSAGYRDIDTFAVTYTRGPAGAPYSVLFHRRGWFSWQIDAVELNS